MNKLMLTTGVVAMAFAAWANEFDAVVVSGTTDRANPVGYRVGDEITFTFGFDPCPAALTNGTCRFSWRLRADGVKGEERGAIPLDGRPLQLKTKAAHPGFVMVEARVVDAADQPIRRDGAAAGAPGWEGGSNELFFYGAAGIDLEKLVQAHAEPEDFDQFWARQKARLAAVPVQAKITPVESPDGAPYELALVKVDCAGPRPCFGWLMKPRKAAKGSLKVTLEVHGYGAWNRQGKPSADAYRPDRVFLAMNAHGCDPTLPDAYYDAFRDGVRTPRYDYAFSPYQNEYPEGCYFNGMALRVIRAIEFLKTLPEWNGKDVEVEGGSQGGLQTMWAAALADGVTVARPSVPWCCDFGADAVQRIVADWRIPYTDALRYYDAVNMAKRAKCRVEITRAGLGDTCCVPSTIAVLYNALPADRRSIVWVQGSRHGYVPPVASQSIELPSGKTVEVKLGNAVYTGRALPESN